MKHFLPFLLLVSALTATANTTYYIADEETNFSNPERGFYTASEQDVSKTTTTSNLNDGAFNATSGRSLVFRQYVFTGFRQDSLSQTVLDMIDADFATYRRNGFKCVLRFSYTVDGDEQDQGIYQDASPAIWEMHLKQLKPIMAANADVIATVQAGFLGVWGEWYYSSQGVGNAIPKTVKTNLINQLLDAVPVCRTVQLRTPKYKTAYMGDSNPLTAAEAFTGTARARLAHHNDAFLYEANNMGTYTNRSKDMDYLDQECLYLPNGGESDVTTTSVYNKWATGEHAKADMSKLHYSYLNQDYSQLVISNWRKEGAFTFLAMHMGYRFQLIEATIPALVRPTETLSVKMNIRNTGYATPYNERPAYIILRNTDTTYVLPLESDPRFWTPNGGITMIDESLSLPSDIIEGTYDVALWLPDYFESIKYDPRYAIRLANANVWEATTGYNLLGMQVLVSATAPEPQPTPEPTPTASADPITHLGGTAGYAEANLNWVNPGTAPISDTLTVDLANGVDTAYNADLGNSSATVSYADGVSTVNYTTHSSWLWAGSRYPVDSLTGITSVTFDYKGDGSSISLISYAHDGKYRWIEDEGSSVQLNAKKWNTYTFVPTTPLWNDAAPTHAFGDKPVTDIGFIANPMSASSGTFYIRNLKIAKERPVVDNFEAVRIIRKEGSMPTSLSDGITVYFGRANQCVDAGLEHGHTYYYAAYAYDKLGQVALPATFSITIDGTGIDKVYEAKGDEAKGEGTKWIQNGRLVILRNGVIYDAMGNQL